MPFGISLAIGLGATAFSTTASALGAGKASDAQEREAQDALDFQKMVYDQGQRNLAPYIQAGQTSVGDLMQGVQDGRFNAGPAPQFTGAPFQAPTLEDARNSPGYQFTLDQGTKVLQHQQAAQGQSNSGGELQALARYTTGLADSTYNDVFNRALSTYGTTLSDYNAKLAAYQATLAGKGQEYNQLAGLAGTGQTAIQSATGAGNTAATNIGSLMVNSGQAQAAGILGTTNALGNGANQGANLLTQAQLYKQLFPQSTPAGSSGTLPFAPGGGTASTASWLQGLGPG